MFFFSVIGAIQMRYDDDDDDAAGASAYSAPQTSIVVPGKGERMNERKG